VPDGPLFENSSSLGREREEAERKEREAALIVGEGERGEEKNY
jgi:hypothetical protein